MQCTLAVVLCVLIAAPACPAPPNPDPKNACAYVMASSLQPTELCVAPAYGCVASFSRSRHSCNFACSAANMACTAAFDDAFDDGRCPPGRQVLPEKELHSKVCSCRLIECGEVGYETRHNELYYSWQLAVFSWMRRTTHLHYTPILSLLFHADMRPSPDDGSSLSFMHFLATRDAQITCNALMLDFVLTVSW